MVASVRRAWRRAMSLSSHWVVWARNTAVKVVLLTALTTFQLWLAFFMYGTFYYAYMPTELHTKPVYLDFSLCDRFDGSEVCPFPHANISLVKHPGQERLFMPGQKYHVRLDMDMPQSPVNENLGVFMVNIQTFSKSDEITSKSLRPAMIRYRSPLLKMINVVCLAPLFLTGYSEEKQVLQINLMDDFIDNAYKPSIKIGLELRAKKIEMYSAVLKIHAQFTGLRYLMFYWPVSSALVSVISNFCFLTVLSMMMWQQCVGYLIDEPSLEEREVPLTSPVLTYEERRRMARQSMGQERSALFRNRPPHVTIIDPLDPAPHHAPIAPSPSTSQPGPSDHPASPSESPQKHIRKRTSRTSEGLSADGALPEVPSSGISSDNSDSNQKGGEQKVETLKGDDSLSGYSDATTSSTGLEDDDDDDRGEEVYYEKEEDGKDEVADVNENVASPQPTSGILRNRHFKSP